MVSDKWYLQPHIATGRSHPCGISSLLLCLEAGTCCDTRRMPTVLVEEEEKEWMRRSMEKGAVLHLRSLAAP